MRKLIVTILFCYSILSVAFSQSVGIGTTTPNTSAQLDVSSSSKGILIPRMTTGQRDGIANPANGLMIYNTTIKQYNFYNNTRWQTVSGIPKGAMVLSNSNYDSNFIKEGFVPDGFLTQDYVKLVVADTTIAANNWYLGNRNDYQNSSAPSASSTIAGFTGTALFVFQNTGSSGSIAVTNIYDPVNDKWSKKPIADIAIANIINEVIENGTIIWTGTEFLLWGGGIKPLICIPTGCTYSPLTNSGVRYNPATDSWALMSITNAPVPRYYHKAVWTGAEMIVWGGKSKETDSLNSFENTGGRYNPISNTWQPLSIPPSFEGRQNFTMTYVENKIIIWGGKSIEPKTRTITFPCGIGTVANFDYDSVRNYNNGIIYNTTNNSWTTMGTLNAPMGRYDATAEWYYDRLIVAGGTNTTHIFECGFCGFFPTACGKVNYKDSVLRTGAAYNPSLNTWTAISDAPKAFTRLSTFFDDDQYIWMYGADTTILYEPSADDWLLLPQNPLPVFNSPLHRQLVWQSSISNNAIFEKIALPGILHPSGKAAVYNYKVSPTTLPEIKSSSTEPATKFYLYKKE